MNPDAHSFIPKKSTITSSTTSTTVVTNQDYNMLITPSPPHSPTHFNNNVIMRTNSSSNNVNNFNEYFNCHICQRVSLKRDVSILCNTHPLICFKCMQRCLTRQVSETVNDNLTCPCYGCSRILTDSEIKRSLDPNVYAFLISKTNRIPSSPIISPSPPPVNSSRSPSPSHKTSELVFVNGATNVTTSTLYGGNGNSSFGGIGNGAVGNLPTSSVVVPGGIYSVNSENFAANVRSSMVVVGRNKKSELVPTPDRFRKMFCTESDTVAENQFIQELPDDFWNSQNVYGF